MPAPIRNQSGFLLIFLFLLLGDMLGISQISPTLNYNYMNGSLLFIGFGLLLTYDALKREWSRPRNNGLSEPGDAPESKKPVAAGTIPPGSGSARWICLLPLLGGWCGGFDVFIKFSSALPYALLMLIFLAFGRHFKAAGLFTLGVLLGLGTYFLFFQPYEVWHHNFTNAVKLQTSGYYNVFKILGRQVADFKRIGINLLQIYLGPLAVLLFLSWKSRRNPIGRWWLIAIFILLEGFLSWQTYKLTNFRFYTLFYLIIILTLAVLLPFVYRVRLSGGRLLICLILLLYPFLLVFGSGSSFSYSIPVFLLPWFGLMLVLCGELPVRSWQVAALACLVLLGEAQFVAGYLYFPWRWVGNRLAQTEEIRDIKGLNGIRVSPPVRRFMEKSRALAAKAAPRTNGYILGIYEMPGVVYWLDGISPGQPFYFKPKNAQGSNCAALTTVNPDKLEHALLLVQDEIHPKFKPCLDKAGIDPARYQVIGKAFNPYSAREVVFYVR